MVILSFAKILLLSLHSEFLRECFSKHPILLLSKPPPHSNIKINSYFRMELFGSKSREYEYFKGKESHTAPNYVTIF